MISEVHQVGSMPELVEDFQCLICFFECYFEVDFNARRRRCSLRVLEICNMSCCRRIVNAISGKQWSLYCRVVCVSQNGCKMYKMWAMGEKEVGKSGDCFSDRFNAEKLKMWCGDTPSNEIWYCQGEKTETTVRSASFIPRNYCISGCTMEGKVTAWTEFRNRERLEPINTSVSGTMSNSTVQVISGLGQCTMHGESTLYLSMAFMTIISSPSCESARNWYRVL